MTAVIVVWINRGNSSLVVGRGCFNPVSRVEDAAAPTTAEGDAVAAAATDREWEPVGCVSGLIVAQLSKLVRVSLILGTNLEKILKLVRI